MTEKTKMYKLVGEHAVGSTTQKSTWPFSEFTEDISTKMKGYRQIYVMRSTHINYRTEMRSTHINYRTEIRPTTNLLIQKKDQYIKV